MQSKIEPMMEADRGDVGTWLRKSREKSGRSLRQIADSTKLSMRTLEALERNKATQLPGGIYGRSVVRSYAREVGLDPELALQRFLAEHPQDPDTLPPSAVVAAPDPRPAGGVLRTAVGVLGALIPLAVGVVSAVAGFTAAHSDRRVLRSESASRATTIPHG